MEDPKIFFSYSRDDSKFVQELARKLRSAGAHLWLDQLDIPAGKL
jgi:TIR domain